MYNETFLESFKQRELIPAITTKHKTKAPATFANGSYPIDEIFVSSSLDILECGYLEHGRNNGDHRPVWIELAKEDALGTNPPPVATYAACRLKTNDP